MHKWFCWFCNKEFEYDGEQYRDVNCLHCGVQNSIFPPNKPDWTPTEGYKEGEEEMGQLAELAKKQSKFLILDLNESIEGVFVDYKIIPSQYDPEKNTVQYTISVNEQNKFWTNGSGAIMKQFDVISKGSKIRITRSPMMDKAGNVVERKSSYKIEEI